MFSRNTNRFIKKRERNRDETKMSEKKCLKCGSEDFTVSQKTDYNGVFNVFKCDKCGAIHRFSIFGNWTLFFS